MNQRAKEFLLLRLSPFRAAAFRAFYIAQMLSLVGTWSHELARSYMALDIGGTTAALGSILLASALPGLFLTLHGGVLADRLEPRKILLLTKSLHAVSAISFFFVAHFFELQLWTIYIFSFIEGLLNSYDSPAYTAMFQRLVPRKDFKMAVVLQSSSFHMCRMLGPAIAGLIMAFYDAHWVFLFDAISYLGVILAVYKTQLRTLESSISQTTNVKTSSWSFLVGGMNYFFRNPSLRYKLLQFLLTISILMPILTVVFRSYLKEKFDLDGSEFGFLFSFPALGSMLGAFIFILANFKEPIRVLRVSIPAILICLGVMLYLPSANYAGAMLALAGLFTYMSVNSITQSLHFEIEEKYRGRLGSIIALGFIAISPLMSFPIAIYTDTFGFDHGIIDPAMVYGLGSLFLAVLHGKLPPTRFSRSRHLSEIPPTTGNPYNLSVKPD